MSFKNPQYLVETDWLESQLGDPGLRILDCTVYMPNYFDESAEQNLEIISGLAHWQEGHIPGSVYADLTTDLRDPGNDRFMFPMPSHERFSDAMSRLGVSNDSKVVLYDDMVNCFATRLFWMLRAMGFDNASVLNGGWAKWTAENRPVTKETPSLAAGDFKASFRPERIATKDQVLAATGDATCIVNALDPDEYAGRGPNRYGRPGHIPGSANLSFLGVIDMENNNVFLSPDELRKQVEGVGALSGERVITYCGGAIAATSAAFVMTLLGVEDVAVYDGSLTEWAADPNLPLVTGHAVG